MRSGRPTLVRGGQGAAASCRTLPAPSASFGVSEYPRNGESLDDFLKAADRALYRAKQEGRDQVRAAEPAPRG